MINQNGSVRVENKYCGTDAVEESTVRSINLDSECDVCVDCHSDSESSESELD